MPALQVKDCPADVYEQLRTVAAEENRSISQQTLVIIKEFLRLRAAGGFQPQPHSRRQFHSYVNTERTDGIDYAAKHQAAMERIMKLPPIPHSETFPSSVEILRQIREEEAR